MNLQELKKQIDFAIKDVKCVIEKNPKAVLSEGDLERLLSYYISKRIGYVPENPDPNNFAVYSQISHYKNDNNILDARVDLVLMRPNEIEPDTSLNKHFVYKAKESFAIELKYRHLDENRSNNASSVKAAKEDIKKYDRYKKESYYYAIILLDESDNTSECEKEILGFYKEMKKQLGKEYNNKFFCKVLKKKAE